MELKVDHNVTLYRRNAETYRRFLYRYDHHYTNFTDGSQKITIECIGYEILKETDKGFWILKHTWYDYQQGKPPQRFVLKVTEQDMKGRYRAPKRWAYEDKQLAWESFKIRKDWQALHLKRQYDQICRVNEMIQNDQKQHRFPGVFKPNYHWDDY
jgi:hypothetical protein